MADYTASLTEPTTLTLDAATHPVTSLNASLVGGTMTVIGETGRTDISINVTELTGPPLTVDTHGEELRLRHGGPSTASGPFAANGHFPAFLTSIASTFGIDLGTNAAAYTSTTVALTVKVPAELTATIKSVSAGVMISALTSRVTVKTVSGTVTASSAQGAFDVGTVSGAINVSDMAGPFTAKSVSGTITAASTPSPTLTVATVSGDLFLDLITPTATVDTKSVSGDITCRAPLHQGFDATVATSGGPVVLGDDRTHGITGTYATTHGGGALRFKAKALSGKIALLPRDDDELPGATPDDVHP